MEEADLVKMSTKGQLVVPQEIRKRESFKPGDRFVPFLVKDGVLFKKVRIPNVKIEFHKLAREIEEHFKKQRISQKDVAGAIKWARRG